MNIIFTYNIIHVSYPPPNYEELQIHLDDEGKKHL